MPGVLYQFLVAVPVGNKKPLSNCKQLLQLYKAYFNIAPAAFFAGGLIT
jgi:hypothetical protein